MQNQDKSAAIRLAQMQQIFSASAVSLSASIALAAILAFVMHRVVSLPVVGSWFGLIVLFSLSRAVLVWMYRCRVAADNAASLKWLTGFRLLVLLSGLVWGASGFLLFPHDNLSYQMVLVVILVGLTSGSIVSLSSDWFCASTFPLAVLLPLAVRLFTNGNDLLSGIGVALTLYLGFMSMNFLRIYKNIRENTVLRIEANEREKAIKASEERYRLLLSHSPIGIFYYDTNLKITYCNTQFACILRNSVENLAGLDMKILKDRSVEPALIKALSGGLGYYEGLYSATFSNANVWVEMTCAPVSNDEGKVVGGIGIVQDIGKRKEAEAMILQAKEQAETLAQSKADFLANMSHEIRTPMNAIIGLSQLALNQETSSQVRGYLEKISVSSESLLGILNDILDFSKMEAGKLGVERVSFGLKDMLENLYNLFAFRAEEKQVGLEIKTDSALPDVLVGDVLRIQQVLSNLLGNAIKFTSNGKVVLQVRLLEQSEVYAKVDFRVRDTGIGIAPGDMDRIFQPFSQADTSITRRFGGTGLGLVISQRLLQLMDSELHVESVYGEGATFSFELLLGVTTAVSEKQSTRLQGETKPGELAEDMARLGANLKGARVLLAEDNVFNQKVVCELLKLSGVEVDVANDGLEALQWLERNSYDAILMDMQMPQMGGVDATKKIREQMRYDDLPIIALTAGVTQEDREKCVASGMNDFLGKPVNPREMIAVLSHWVGKV